MRHGSAFLVVLGTGRRKRPRADQAEQTLVDLPGKAPDLVFVIRFPNSLVSVEMRLFGCDTSYSECPAYMTGPRSRPPVPAS